MAQYSAPPAPVVGGAGVRRCCRAFGYVDYYEPILVIQPPGIPGIYGKCGPVGCRVAGVRRRSYRGVRYATGCEPVCATQPTVVAGVTLVIGATVT